MIRIATLTTVALALATKGHAGLISSIEVVETMVQTQESGSIFMGSIFGPDSNSTIQFSASFDPVAKTFAYATLPGQSYLGLALSMATNGSYDSQLGQYEWSTTAQLGQQTWTGGGSDVWVGDPTANINTTYVYKGVTYTVTGSIPVDALGHSSGTLTYTSPSGAKYNWASTDFVPGSPSMPITVQANGFNEQVSLDGNLPFPNGGLGNFDVRISSTAVPEPSTMVPLLGGLLYVVWRRRNS